MDRILFRAVVTEPEENSGTTCTSSNQQQQPPRRSGSNSELTEKGNVSGSGQYTIWASTLHSYWSSVTRYGRQKSDQHSPQKATYNSVRFTAPSALLATHARPRWSSCWIDWSHKQRRSRVQHNRANLQSQNTVRKVPPTPTRPQPHLCWLYEGVQKSMAWSPMGHHEAAQH